VLLALNYYLGDPAVEGQRTVSEVLKSVIDVEAMKAQINASVAEAVAQVEDEYDFKPQVGQQGWLHRGRVALAYCGPWATVAWVVEALGCEVLCMQPLGPHFDVTSVLCGTPVRFANDSRRARRHTPCSQVTAILDGLPLQLDGLFAAVDAALGLLSFSEVRPLYERVKGVLCCLTADGVYLQWVASLGLGYLAYLALLASAAVLRKLDSLADGCCGCVCFNKEDYGPAPPPPVLRGALRGGPLSSMGTADDGVVVAQVGREGQGGRGKRAQAACAGCAAVPGAAASCPRCRQVA
jgi:hypothetical protein